MKKLDFTKYSGNYSLQEAKEISKKITSDILEIEKQEDIENVKKIHGDNFTYEVKKGTSVDLRNLKKGQRICASQVKGHHILLTEKIEG